ncbi:acetate--CoA ligase family protein [Pseudonocardia kunmingensis]|uniref:Acyl-CoA synthetase (NDP forming) n=1 Tax=Pseudonocardia kunmingensis TaxID=630975 RepID=A0A543DPP3_9PSEU|nr:acetate--CoA ligase family protein [Pseudonocardia kunmingensis]TQM11284.1 acyl-CoA synthetase (NDP forming) [Pseudonocardia kunmingensis]
MTVTGPARPSLLTGPDLARALFAPRSIALVGASGDPVKAASRPLAYLRRDGYRGAVYAVNRRGGEIGGERAYTGLAELPEVPEHAFLMTPTAATVDTVAECGRAGVRVVTVLTGGFGESGPDGLERERRLRAAGREHGVRILGPNSLGVVNPGLGLTLTANAAFSEPDLRSGGLFVASHSGSMLGALLSRGVARGLGFARMISVGGEVDVSLGEVCAAAVDDPDVTGYLLFLESLRHADRLREFAAAAADRGKPVVAYKLGRSTAAAELAVSHTGALAGEDDVAAAFLADCGIARVHTLDGLLETLPLLRRVAPPAAAPTAERSVGVVTTTGGGAAMVVDQLGVRGVSVAPPSERTRRRLTDAGVHAEPGLIVDLTLAGTRPDVMRAALDVLTDAPEFDLVVAVVGSSARAQPELVVAPITERPPSGTPVAVFVVPEAPQALSMLAAAEVPAFRTPESCADAVAAALARRVPRVRPAPRRQEQPGVRTLDEARSYAVLREQGVPVASFDVLDVDAATGPAELRYPVAVKALSADLPHKSDAGGVVLDVAAPADVPAAAGHIREEVHRRAGVSVDRVLVQPMSTGLAEVLVGYRVDAEVGPLVLVAAGGVLAELHRDRALRTAPVDAVTAREMLTEVTGLTVLRGFRGAPHGDLDALAELVVSVSRLVERPDVVEAEINPALVGPVGQGVVAVDAVVRVACGEAGEDA